LSSQANIANAEAAEQWTALRKACGYDDVLAEHVLEGDVIPWNGVEFQGLYEVKKKAARAEYDAHWRTAEQVEQLPTVHEDELSMEDIKAALRELGFEPTQKTEPEAVYEDDDEPDSHDTIIARWPGVEVRKQGSKWQVVDEEGDSVDENFRTEEAARARLAERQAIRKRVLREFGAEA
jgi:hypothetical protein